MALRLTGTKLASSNPAPAPAPVSAQSLAAQARASLISGDIDGFSAVLTRADDLPERPRRLEARLAALQTALAATRQAPEGVALRTFVAVADAALSMLEADPREPLILNLAGVACYELWALDAAEALFKAARRLDGSLRDPERNLAELAKRKRAARGRMRPLHAAVPGLRARARAVAGKARPAAGLTLSLCMIVRDEEQWLPRCLAAVAPAVDEMIIVDTGSTDSTIEIARSFGAKVIEFPWTGSFSEARNVSFEAATGDWLIYLDADELLVAEDVDKLRGLLGRTWREAFYLVETSHLGELGDGSAQVNNALRVFRNRPEYRFKDRLHEQIWHTLPTYLPDRLEQSTVRVEHYGYLGAVREAKEKSQRNLELLLQQAKESPSNPFLHFNLGSEYAAAGDAASAVTEFERAWELLDADGSLAGCTYAPALMQRLVTMLRRSGRLVEARTRAQDALLVFPDFTDLIYNQAAVAQLQGDVDEAHRLYRRCLELGDAPARYGGVVGGGSFLPRIAMAHMALDRGDTGEARSNLEWCVEHHPEFLAVAGPYTGVLLRDGADPADVEIALERLGTLPPLVRLTVATAMAEAGARDAAERQYRLAIEAAPDNARARTSLGELLLARGAWDEAVQQGRAVAGDDPYAPLARRIELFGLVGRADADVVADALARADQAGVPNAEREVFAAWAAIAAGAAAPEGLPVAGVPLLAVILETLLGARDTDRFNALVPALQRSRLERREQRELLANMFLSQGLLGLAAQEWMAVCSEQPDVRALLGLARVSLAHGSEEDAATFAGGALELDPQSAEGHRLLSLATAAVPA